MDLEKKPNISNKGMDFIPKIKVDYNPETEEEEPQFIYEEEEPKEEEPKEEEPKEEKPSVINEEEIFTNIPKKKRKPMSEEHKAKLKLAREKALAVRRAKAQEKKNMKDLEKEEKELVKKKQIKRVQKLKEEVESDEEEYVKPKKKITIAEQIKIDNDMEHGEYVKLSRKDIEELQLNAIMGYDAVRKERKKEKIKINEEDKRKEKIQEKLHRALNPRNNFNNYSSYGGF